MLRLLRRLTAVSTIVLGLSLGSASALAQGPGWFGHGRHGGGYPAVVCPSCGQVHARPGPFWRGGRMGDGAGNFVNPYVGPNRLPRGQVYYNGRYFGDFNNRFFGPQYGYF
jgi:hypothetical protein